MIVKIVKCKLSCKCFDGKNIKPDCEYRNQIGFEGATDYICSIYGSSDGCIHREVVVLVEEKK